MGDAEWVRLKRFNDWGVDYFAEEGKGLSAHGTSDARKYGLRIKAGDELHVRWPDGSVTREKVVLHPMRREVSDMGKTYPVTFALPGIAASDRGMQHFVALDEVDVDRRDLPT